MLYLLDINNLVDYVSSKKKKKKKKKKNKKKKKKKKKKKGFKNLIKIKNQKSKDDVHNNITDKIDRSIVLSKVHQFY